MKLIYFFALSIFLLNLSSCAQCNFCTKGNAVEDICTNSVLDRAKAKSVCKKEGGEWSKADV